MSIYGCIAIVALIWGVVRIMKMIILEE